jgi:predicted transcriptional regulator
LSEREPTAALDSGEETKLFHERYLVAVNNPSRRKILEALREGCATIEEIVAKTNLDKEVLIWHLSLLVSSRCVEEANASGNPSYKLTQAGKVIEFME